MKAIDIKHAAIGTVTSRVDGAVSFRVITPELTIDQRATILAMHGKNVRCMVEPLDVPTTGLDSVDTESDLKNPSQRLRAVLFIWWKSEKPDVTFNEFYHSKMEKVIEWVKTKLPESYE
jgi:hypothetical protein